jgi:hypothetical protein
MCEASQHLVEAAAQIRIGAAAAFGGDQGVADGSISSARSEMDTVRGLLDEVRHSDYGGGPTWSGLARASNAAAEALGWLSAGDASEALRRADAVMGHLDAVSPPLPDTCLA